MDKLEIISKQANNIYSESFNECQRIWDEISKQSIDTDNRAAIAKKNISDSALLSGQIIKALDIGSLLLALIGLRSLTESYINTKYTFAHPEKESLEIKILWANKVCDDYFTRGNDPKAQKAFLNEETIKKRAKEAGLEELYEKDFVSLCNYSHMQIHTCSLNKQKYIEDFNRNAYVSALVRLDNICEMIQKHYDIKRCETHSNHIEEFIKNYYSE